MGVFIQKQQIIAYFQRSLFLFIIYKAQIKIDIARYPEF